MMCRRTDDLLIAVPRGGVPVAERPADARRSAVLPLCYGPWPGSQAALSLADEPLPAVLLLVNEAGGEAMLVAGADVRVLPGPASNDTLAALAENEAASLLRRRARVNQWAQLPERLLAFYEALLNAVSAAEVCLVVAEHAARIVSGYGAFVFLPEGAQVLRLASAGSAAKGGAAIAVPWHSRFARAGLLMAPDLWSGDDAFRALARVVASPQVATLAHVPFGDGGVLLLSERREERVFRADDWLLLGSLAAHGTAALRRVRQMEETRGLALTDPLTGLANRRHLDAVLQHAWAAAQRGEPLALILLDLDGFKAVNDCFGHTAGDQVLRSVGECLRRETRGADVVARYGGDEFMVVLPHGNAEAAAALAARVRARLPEGVRFSAGVACYEPGMLSADELIGAADHALYLAKLEREHGGGAGALV